MTAPQEDYCTALSLGLSWNTLVMCGHLALSNIQRRATKFILNYPKNMSSQERLIKTNLLPLEFHREILDLQLFYKSKNRLIHWMWIITYVPMIQAIHHVITMKTISILLPNISRTTSGIRFL
jgi:hypothetical protein